MAAKRRPVRSRSAGHVDRADRRQNVGGASAGEPAKRVSVRDIDDAPELYAEDAVVEHPFLGHGQRMEGREQLREHFAAGSTTPVTLEARNIVIHQSSDPEVITAEFEYHGEVTTTGTRFVAPNVFVMRIRDGLIVESRDYGNHLVLAHATDRVPELLTLFDAPEQHGQ